MTTLSEMDQVILELEKRLKYPWSTFSLLKECFSEKQRERALQEWRRTRDIIQTYATINNVSRHIAIIELAHHRGSLSQARYLRLLKAIGARVRRRMGSNGPRPKPEYRDGRLFFGEVEIRRIKQYAKPSRIQILLDAFERSRWRRKIPNPWWGKPDQDKVHRAVDDLKKGLRTISFEVTDGSRSVRWVEKE